MTFFSQVKKSRDEDYIERREGELESLDKIEIAEDLSVEEEDEDLLCYENIEEIWPDYPTKDDFFFNEDEY